MVGGKRDKGKRDRGKRDREMASIKSHRELRVYQMAMDVAMRVFELTKGFPAEERFSMVDQVRRSSRSVCANIAEAWRRRRYEAHFVSKLNDAECEAEETRVWLEFARRCAGLLQAPRLPGRRGRGPGGVHQSLTGSCAPSSLRT